MLISLSLQRAKLTMSLCGYRNLPHILHAVHPGTLATQPQRRFKGALRIFTAAFDFMTRPIKNFAAALENNLVNTDHIALANRFNIDRYFAAARCPNDMA